MKKYMILAASTSLAIAAIVAVSSLSKPAAVNVSLYTVSAHTVRHTVDYTGKVESAESKSVYTEVACIAGDVLVKPGQMVEKGDVLFTIDTDATKQVAATLGRQSQLIDLDNLKDIKNEVTAPVRGIVSTLNVTEGDITDTSKPCAVISSGEALQVKIGVPEKGLSHIYEGQEVSLSGVAFDKDSYRGTVTEISPSARTQLNGSVSETVIDTTVTINPEDVDDSLRVGLSAKACITLEVFPNALIVPYETVQQDNEGQEYVYVCKNGRAEKRVITTGNELSEGFEVLTGLSDGEQIVSDPTKVDKNGAAVTST